MRFAFEGLDEARATVAQLVDVLEDQQVINATVATATRALVQDNLRVNYVPKPNWLGAPSTGFWKDAADGVTAESEGTATTVRIRSKGARLRYYGGVVRPTGRISEVTGRPIKFLAYPINAAVYGKTPAEVSYKLYPKGGALYAMLGDRRSESDPRMFRLARKTTHKPDPGILPGEQAVLNANAEALAEAIDAIMEA